jgi:hypothetical protein
MKLSALHLLLTCVVVGSMAMPMHTTSTSSIPLQGEVTPLAHPADGMPSYPPLANAAFDLATGHQKPAQKRKGKCKEAAQRGRDNGRPAAIIEGHKDRERVDALEHQECVRDAYRKREEKKRYQRMQQVFLKKMSEGAEWQAGQTSSGERLGETVNVHTESSRKDREKKFHLEMTAELYLAACRTLEGEPPRMIINHGKYKNLPWTTELAHRVIQEAKE